MTVFHSISDSVQDGNTRQTAILVAQALDAQQPPADIIKDGLAAGMLEITRRYSKNEVMDSHVLVAGCAMKAGLKVLQPALENTQGTFLGTAITGTLEGDIREAEKDICVYLMKSRGLKVIDLGASVSNAKFVEAAIDERADIIVCNTSLTIFMPLMKSLVQTANQADIRARTKVLLSGGPVTELFCKSIEADMYAQGPIQAAEMAAEHCRKLRSHGTEKAVGNPI